MLRSGVYGNSHNSGEELGDQIQIFISFLKTKGITGEAYIRYEEVIEVISVLLKSKKFGKRGGELLEDDFNIFRELHLMGWQHPEFFSELGGETFLEYIYQEVYILCFPEDDPIKEPRNARSRMRERGLCIEEEIEEIEEQIKSHVNTLMRDDSYDVLLRQKHELENKTILLIRAIQRILSQNGMMLEEKIKKIQALIKDHKKELIKLQEKTYFFKKKYAKYIEIVDALQKHLEQLTKTQEGILKEQKVLYKKRREEATKRFKKEREVFRDRQRERAYSKSSSRSRSM